MDLGCRALARDVDVEHAAESEKLPFRIAPQENVRCGGMAKLRLARSLAGVLLLFPACMLVMSNYAMTKGLLQGCSRFELLPLGVSRGFHKLLAFR
jgi:hypothetical protein